MPNAYFMKMRRKRALSAVGGIRAGMLALKRKDPRTATEILREAVDVCSVERKAVLSRALYWLSVGLLRERRMETALRSLSSSQRLSKRGFARALYLRFSNDYGMLRRGCASEDDRAAFYSVHLSRYFEGRARRSFASECERDVIHALIGDAWKVLQKSSMLCGRSAIEKARIFRAVKIVFPGAMPRADVADWTIPVNFRSGTRLVATDQCFCGSGLSYGRCCGRSAGISELERGI
jgi:hypothetical protein